MLHKNNNFYIEKYHKEDEKELIESFIEFSNVRIQEDPDLHHIPKEELIRNIKYYLDTYRFVLNTWIIKKVGSDKIYWFIMGKNHVNADRIYTPSANEFHITYLYVSKEAQWKGLSSKLKDKIENYAKKEKFDTISISVSAKNIKAKEIYLHWKYNESNIKLKKKI